MDVKVATTFAVVSYGQPRWTNQISVVPRAQALHALPSIDRDPRIIFTLKSAEKNKENDRPEDP
jgi:hypothetical protein